MQDFAHGLQAGEATIDVQIHTQLVGCKGSTTEPQRSETNLGWKENISFTQDRQGQA
jgi:hypothetical protein